MYNNLVKFGLSASDLMDAHHGVMKKNMDIENSERTDHYSFLSDKHWITDPVQAFFMSRPRKALFGMAMKHQPGKILDVCCGTGVMASRFTSIGVETTGVDSSPSMLKQATEKSRLTYSLLMDASLMAFEKEFDAAYINLAIHELAPDLRDKVWQRMLRAVRVGGVIIAMDLNAPKYSSFPSRFWQSFFELDERNFLKTNPEHYHNYREFMSMGGVCEWVKARSSKIEDEKYFFNGNIAVLSAIV